MQQTTIEQPSLKTNKLSDVIRSREDQYYHILDLLGFKEQFYVNYIEENHELIDEGIFQPATDFRVKEELNPQLDTKLIALICLVAATKEIKDESDAKEAFNAAKDFLTTQEGQDFIKGIFFSRSDNSIEIMIYSNPQANGSIQNNEQLAA